MAEMTRDYTDAISVFTHPVIVDGFVTTQRSVLDSVIPKFVLNSITEPFNYFGKRNVDLLDFFRHAFQPHRGSQQPDIQNLITLFPDEQPMRYVFE